MYDSVLLHLITRLLPYPSRVPTFLSAFDVTDCVIYFAIDAVDVCVKQFDVFECVFCLCEESTVPSSV